MAQTYISKAELMDYPQLRKVRRLETPEDVATLVNTYMDVRNTPGIDFANIEDVYEDGGRYVFVLNNYHTSWDILSYINQNYDSRTKIKGDNLGLLFPSNLSRRDIGIEMRGSRSNYYQNTTPNRGTNGVATGFRDNYTRDLVNISQDFVRNREFVVGRSSKMSLDYIVRDPSNPPKVSKTHCKFYYDRGSLWVVDADSKNGTFVNGRRLNKFQPEMLRIGDKVRLANYELEII